MRKSTPWGWGCRIGGLQPNGRVFPSADKLTGWQTHGRAGSTQVRTVGPPSHSFLANFGARRFPKGNEGKRVSSGYNRRRRLATRSSGKQQAERTAVRTAPIVCPEESPLVRPWAQSPCPGWGLTRRLRRGWWGCRPEGGKYFLSKRKKVPKKARGTATPEAAHVAMHCDQALRCAWAWLRASWLSAISGASRPPWAVGFGLQ